MIWWMKLVVLSVLGYSKSPFTMYFELELPHGSDTNNPFITLITEPQCTNNLFNYSRDGQKKF